MGKKEKNNVNISRKILTLLPRILYNILIFFCIILIAIIVMQRLTDSNRSVGGYKIFKVVSGSMIPRFDIGDVVICKEIDPKEIKLGDAIVYRGKIGELSNKIVMHEVVDINVNENNELRFYAKGINTNQEDPAVTEEQILGVAVHTSDILTLLYKLATSIYSSFIIITILVINVFISFNSDRIKKLMASKEDEDEKSSSKQNLQLDENIKKEENTNLELEKNLQSSKELQADLQLNKELEEEKLQTNKELQEEIKNLKSQIEQLKKQDNIENNFEKKSQKNIKNETTKKSTISKNNTRKMEKNYIDIDKDFDKIEDAKNNTKRTSKRVENNIEKKKKNTSK